MNKYHGTHDCGNLPKLPAGFGLLILLALNIFLLPALTNLHPVMASESGGKPIIIGLDADMTSASALSGQSIFRGAAIAIEEINSRGGVLGRFLTLEVKDHRGNPARGKDNMAAFAAMPDLVAVLGGLHTPVALEVLPIVHEHRIPFLIPWAAGTRVVENKYEPNFVFRVSVNDACAGPFLVQAAFEAGFRRPGLLLENTGWGRSNLQAMLDAIDSRDMSLASVKWFNWGVRDLSAELNGLVEDGADMLMLVANAPEGLVLVRSMAGIPAENRLPVISHWGISGGEFASLAKDDLHRVELAFLQTFNFAVPPFPGRADALFRAYQNFFPGIEDPVDIPAAPGLAHAYDLVHLLAKAIKDAGNTERGKIRDALESIESYAGVMADYRPPFTPYRHDALGPESFMLARFNHRGQVVPAYTR